MNFNLNLPKGKWGFVSLFFLTFIVFIALRKPSSAASVLFLGGVILAAYNLSSDSRDSVWWTVFGICFVVLLILAIGFAPSEW